MSKRPLCTSCGLELVFAAIRFGNQVFSAWLCDCTHQPEGVKTDIVLAREWDDQSVVYTMEYIGDGNSESDDEGDHDS